MRGYLCTVLAMLLIGCVEVMEPFEVVLNGESLNEGQIEEAFSDQEEGYYYADFDTLSKELFIRYDAEVTSREAIHDVLTSRNWLVDTVTEELLPVPEQQDTVLAPVEENVIDSIEPQEPLTEDTVELTPALDSAGFSN